MRNFFSSTAVLAFLFMLHTSIQAQEVSPKAKVHELGLAIPHLNSSRGGLIYRVGNADALWRFGLYGLNNQFHP